MNPLVLLGVIAVVAVVFARRQNRQLQKHITRVPHYLPKAIGVLVLTAQFSELVKVVEHISVVNITAALMLFVIMVTTKSGTEGEPH